MTKGYNSKYDREWLIDCQGFNGTLIIEEYGFRRVREAVMYRMGAALKDVYLINGKTSKFHFLQSNGILLPE